MFFCATDARVLQTVVAGLGIAAMGKGDKRSFVYVNNGEAKKLVLSKELLTAMHKFCTGDVLCLDLGSLRFSIEDLLRILAAIFQVRIILLSFGLTQACVDCPFTPPDLNQRAVVFAWAGPGCNLQLVAFGESLLSEHGVPLD
jgi:hypothetical protein